MVCVHCPRGVVLATNLLTMSPVKVTSGTSGQGFPEPSSGLPG